MAHVIYDNEVIQNRAESILNSKLNAVSYMTVDNSLTAADGDHVTINTYEVTGELEELTEGEGNTKEFEVSYVGKQYEVKTLQGKFKYTDEQAMKDSFAIDTLIDTVADEFINVANKRYFEELANATLEISGTASTGVTFENVVDALALFKENDKVKYMFVNPAQVAKLRKNLKDLLSYQEDFIRTGYIGTVAGVPIVMSNCVPDGSVFIATSEAVKMFNKKGVENEPDRNPDIRTTYNYLRKVYTIAFVDAREAVKITLA